MFVRDAREAFMPGRASPEDEAALDAHILASVAFRARTTALVLNGFHLLFWPTDPYLLVREGEVFAAMGWFRLTTFINHAALFGLLSLRPVVRHAVPVVTVCIAISATIMGSTLARMGALDRPYLHMSYLAPMAMAGIPVRLAQRVFMTSVLGAGLLGGFLLTRPSELSSKYLPTSLGSMLFAVALSVALGHLLFLLERRAFMNGRALQRSEAALKSHNDELADTVSAQTRELRRLASHLSRATEDERRRLQRELHDELGQQLVGIRYTVAFLQQRLRKDPEQAQARLSALESLVSQLQEGVQHLVVDLRPRIIDDRGLGAAAAWLVETTQARSGVSCELHAVVDERVTIDGALAMDAFRILQESLSNALKHAEPERLRVSLTITPEAIEMTVTDDGCGVQDRADAPSGMGVVGMRERARAHGGTFALDPAPDGGTVVRVRLPVAAEPAS